MLCAVALLAQSGYKLIFSDEFNYRDVPDPKKWGYEVGFVRNGEKQYYTKGRLQNARVSGGNLTLEARKDGFEAHEISSASITTQDKFSFTYGKVEVRAKIPTGRGTWPAIWMLGSNISQVGWPKCGEIDIMENVGYDPEMVHFNPHCETFNHTKNNAKGKGIPAGKIWEDFHTFGIEWTSDRIEWLYDGKKVHEFAKQPAADVNQWPFDKPQYLILNLAIGGAWGGQKGIDDSIFPSRFVIDYVRVWQKQ